MRFAADRSRIVDAPVTAVVILTLAAGTGTAVLGLPLLGIDAAQPDVLLVAGRDHALPWDRIKRILVPTNGTPRPAPPRRSRPTWRNHAMQNWCCCTSSTRSSTRPWTGGAQP
jgi:hypothetical protein